MVQNTDFIDGMISGAQKCEEAKKAGQKPNMFDWDKAVKLIKEHNIQTARAGLAGDWDNTSGLILMDGYPIVGSYVYLQSYWATPIIMDMATGKEYPCYRKVTGLKSENAERLWPAYALEKLGVEPKQLEDI
jgi:hypothetical protein